MTESSPSLDGASGDSEGVFAWSIRPSLGRPGAMVFAISTIIIMSSLIAVMGGDWIWGALSAVVLFLTSSRFFLTSRISISPEGIRAEFPLKTRFMAWSEIEMIRHDRSAALIRLRKRRFRKAETTILFNDTAHQALESMIRFAPAGLVEAVDP